MEVREEGESEERKERERMRGQDEGLEIRHTFAPFQGLSPCPP